MTSTSPTRLSPARYLELLAADGTRLGDVAATQLDRPVPTCPGWDLADLVRHTGSTFNHKVTWLQTGHRPEPEQWDSAPGTGEDLVTWYRRALSAVSSQLRDRDALEAAPTWYPAEQTVGFWQRRMAQEAAIHRVDAESAADDVTPVDNELALDGVDEILAVMLPHAFSTGSLAPPEMDLLSRHSGRAVLVRTGPHAWHLQVTPGATEQVALTRQAGSAQATVSGEPSELVLWLWGRRPDTAVVITGDPGAAAALRALLAAATQ